MKVTVWIYNEAGERVRLLFEGTTQLVPSNLGTDKSLLSVGYDQGLLPGPGQVSLQLHSGISNGTGGLVWNGQNDNGQFVEGGSYYFKAEFEDSFGTKTSLIHSLSVVSALDQTNLEIFNSAGESVRRFVIGTAASGATAFSTDKASFSPANDPAKATAENILSLKVQPAQGTPVNWAWDGRNSQGELVDSGTYSLRLSSSRPDGGTVTILHTVTLVKNGLDLKDPAPRLGPNPAGPRDSGTWIFWTPQNGQNMAAGLYNGAGELIAAVRDARGNGRAFLPLRGLASGVYFVEVEVRNGASLQSRKALKLAILH